MSFQIRDSRRGNDPSRFVANTFSVVIERSAPRVLQSLRLRNDQHVWDFLRIEPLQHLDGFASGDADAAGRTAVEAALDMEEDRASLVLLDRAHVVFDHGGIAVYLVVAAKVFEIVGPGRLLRHPVVKRIFGIADPIVLFAHDDERPRQIDIALVSERESHRIGSAGRSAVSFSFLAVRRDAGPADVRAKRIGSLPPLSVLFLVTAENAGNPVGPVVVYEYQLTATVRQTNLLVQETFDERVVAAGRL